MRRFLSALATATLVSSAVAQTTAAVLQYGRGCASTHAYNLGIKPQLDTATLPNEYAYGFTAARDITVLGFSMLTRTAMTTGGPVKITCAFYPQDPLKTSQPAATAATTGELVAGTRENFYTCVFKTKQVVKKGHNLWVSQLDANSVLACSTSNGQQPLLNVYWRRTGWAWTPTGVVKGPVIQLILEGETPILAATGVPKLGEAQFSVDVTNGPTTAGAGANLILGISDTKSLSGLTLPFDLAILGFNGCLLYASDEFRIGPNPLVGGARKFPLPIPNTGSLNGVSFYTQVFTVDIINNKVMFSNATKQTVGN